ncbi:hypothetical protein ACFV1L_10290 [Kitasatospora sp. NPDC059646]|uniref:hypothetical protein n=1 Tax=Kitasatospora sp. NPDC059646 TaxID=3346893 RepID=UPI0036BC7036
MPYPKLSDAPNIESAMSALVAAVAPRLNMIFASASARNAAVTAPVAGMRCWLIAEARMEVYDGTAWRRYITWSAGGTPQIDALTITGVGATLHARRDGDSTPRTSTAMVDDSVLTVPVVANAVYEVSAVLVFSGPAGGDFQEQLSVPSGAGYRLSMRGQDRNASATVGTVITDVQSAAQTWGTIGTQPMTCSISGILRTGASAGSVTLQWGQGASTSPGTVLERDSFITLVRRA